MSTKILGLTTAGGALALLLAVTNASPAPQRSDMLPASAGRVSSFAFDRAHPGTLYVGASAWQNAQGQVYKTTDGGDHWRLISGRNLGRWLGALTVDPRRSRTLYAGTGAAVYKTTNGGRSWHSWNSGLLPPPGINRGEGWVDWLAVDPRNSKVLYEHDYANTIRKSTDGGHTWRVLVSQFRRGAVEGLLMVPGSRPALYAAFSISGPGGKGPGVYRSTTGGKTWHKMSLPGPYLFATAALDRQKKTIYVGLGGRIFASADAGRHWRFLGQVPPDQAVTSLTAGAGAVVATDDNGIFQSLDGGTTWKRTWPVGDLDRYFAGIVTVDPTIPTTVYAAVYFPETDTGPVQTQILRSTDSGSTWAVMG